MFVDFISLCDFAADMAAQTNTNVVVDLVNRVDRFVW